MIVVILPDFRDRSNVRDGDGSTTFQILHIADLDGSIRYILRADAVEPDKPKEVTCLAWPY